MKIFSVVLTFVILAAAIFFFYNPIMREAASVGIIGGADGPTAIFITGKISD